MRFISAICIIIIASPMSGCADVSKGYPPGFRSIHTWDLLEWGCFAALLVYVGYILYLLGYGLVAAIRYLDVHLFIPVGKDFRAVWRKMKERRGAVRARRIVKKWQAEEQEKQRRVQAEKDAARAHLEAYYRQHQEILAVFFPPALLSAFFRSEMPDYLETHHLWTICQKKIAELHPVVAERLQQLSLIAAEIRVCEEKIGCLSKSSEIAEDWRDETEGLLLEIKRLEAERQKLLLRI